MKHVLLTINVALVIQGVSFAQIDFRPGYVVENSGDTTKGWVAYRSDKKNQIKCSFKRTRSGELMNYLPGEVKGYGLTNGNAYESLMFPPDSPSRGAGFARVLAAGRLRLLGYGNLYFVFDGTEWVTLTPPKETQIRSGDRVTIIRDNLFRTLLNNRMDDCIDKSVEFRYAEKELTDRVMAYNKCKDPGTTAARNRRLIKANLRVLGGYQLSTLKYDMVSKITFENTTGTGGLGVEFSLPQKSDKLFFVLDAMYLTSLYQGYLELQEPDLVRMDVIADVSAIKIPFGFKYALWDRRLSPYLSAGFSWTKLTRSTSHLIRERQTLNEIYRSDFYDLYKFKNPKNYWISVGLTATLKNDFKFFAELRQEGGEGYLGSAVESDSKLVNTVMLCGLRF